MNPKHTHDMWHPGETPEFLQEAVERVNASQTRQVAPQRTEAPQPISAPTPPVPGLTAANTGVRHGVYRQPNGEFWFVTAEEQRNIERRAARRGDVIVDDTIARGKAGQRVVTTQRCRTCQQPYPTSMPQQERRCPQCRDAPAGTLITRTCQNCNTDFTARSRRAKWCSRKCRSQSEYQRRKNGRAA